MFSNRSAGDFSPPTRYVIVAASRSGSTSAVMRLSSPSASTFSSQASRSLALAPRAIGLASVFARCGSPSAASTLTLMSIPLSRLVLLPNGRSLARFEARRIRVGVTARRQGTKGRGPGKSGQEKPAKKKPGASAGRCSLVNAARRSEAGHDALKAQEMGERFELAALVVAKAHHQRVASGFEPLDIDLAHIDRGHAAPALRRLLAVLHLAQFGLDRGPIALLLRRQGESLLDAGNLRIVEHVVGPRLGGRLGHCGGQRHFGGRRSRSR